MNFQIQHKKESSGLTIHTTHEERGQRLVYQGHVPTQQRRQRTHQAHVCQKLGEGTVAVQNSRQPDGLNEGPEHRTFTKRSEEETRARQEDRQGTPARGLLDNSKFKSIFILVNNHDNKNAPSMIDRGDRFIYMQTENYANVVSINGTLSTLLKLSSQQPPFKPCIKRAQWFLSRVSAPCSLSSSLYFFFFFHVQIFS